MKPFIAIALLLTVSAVAEAGPFGIFGRRAASECSAGSCAASVAVQSVVPQKTGAATVQPAAPVQAAACSSAQRVGLFRGPILHGRLRGILGKCR